MVEDFTVDPSGTLYPYKYGSYTAVCLSLYITVM